MENISLGVWEDFTNKIKSNLENKDISTFMTWDILIHTMIAGVDSVEIEYLQNNWNYWGDKIAETALQPNSHQKYPMSSTNNLHHAYSLQVMMDKFGLTLSDFKMVTEFGGGYGNTARLFRKCGFDGVYKIYDIPELCKIQDFYLKQNNVLDINLMMNSDSIKDVPKNSLFLGLWSISETPTSTREYYVESLKIMEHDHIFIAMGKEFYGENNIAWLSDKIIPELEKNNYVCELTRISHGQGMYYFSAKKFYI